MIFGVESRLDKAMSRRQVSYLITEPNSDPSSYSTRSCPSASDAYWQFQPSWLKQHPWLDYNQQVDGAFCQACASFAAESVGGHVPGQFVTKPFKSWNKMSETANAHGISLNILVKND